MRRPPLIVVPLLAYVGVTLVAPLLRGGYREPGFIAHAAIVAGGTGIFGWIWIAWLRRVRAR